ncbi:MAG: hypothetical protein HFACDABA_03258 [Anaerolineales bacterium]|nr:hypothetical protein [Anaerolineales bacterium]
MLNSTNNAENLFSLKRTSPFKKFIFLVVILVILSCSTFTNMSQSTSSRTLNDDDLFFLKNTSSNNLSYIGEDGNIWITDENKDLKITDFSQKSKELPISSFYWSPDGKKIAVQAQNGIYMFILSAKSIDRYFLGLTSFILGDLPQPWSPDSQKILTTQLGFRSLDLWEIVNNQTLEKKTVIKPLQLGSHFIWLPDSQSFVMSEDWLADIGTGTLCSGVGTIIRMSIVDTQTQSKNIVYEGWGTSFDVFTNKIVIIGGDSGCAEYPLVYDLEESQMLEFNQAIVESKLCFGDHRDNVAIFTVSSMIDASQSIFLFDTDTMSYDNIAFGEISKIANFKSNCKGYFWSNDKETLFFNSDVFWGGEVIRVDIQSKEMYPFVGDKKSEPQFIFDLPNAQVLDILDDGNMVVSGVQNGQINDLYYINIEDSQMKRLGDNAFWVTPSYFGQSQKGLLVIQATDIQTQLTNIYWVDKNGDVIKTINNASQPIWQPKE